MAHGSAALSFGRESDGTLLVRLGGSWRTAGDLPAAGAVDRESQGARRVAFDTSDVRDWDSSLVTFVSRVIDSLAAQGLDVDRSGLPAGARRLLDMAAAVPEEEHTGRDVRPPHRLARLGAAAVAAARSGVETVAFLGEITLSFGRFLTGRASFRSKDLWLLLQECGANALPIVTLISFLVGLILAFVGAVQLSLFGAQIYVADLVGIAMARQIGAIMTAIIMAGRTGAAFAAQLGTMTVNEEIDALRTLGVSPIDFLVLPRVIAVVVMMPLLTLYADLLGILGGYFVGVTMLDLTPAQYYQETRAAVSLTQFGLGLICSFVFAVLIATAGCLRGLQCGRSAQAVGLATTSAVVTAIVWIVVSDGILTFVFDTLGV